MYSVINGKVKFTPIEYLEAEFCCPDRFSDNIFIYHEVSKHVVDDVFVCICKNDMIMHKNTVSIFCQICSRFFYLDGVLIRELIT